MSRSLIITKERIMAPLKPLTPGELLLEEGTAA